KSSKQRYERFRRAYQEGKTNELSLYRKKEKDQDFSDRDHRSKKDRRRHYLGNYVRWLWKFWPTVVLLVVLSLLSAVLELAHPLFLRHILDNVLLSDTLATAERIHQLHLIGSGLLVVILLGQCISVFKNYRTRTLNLHVMISLRRSLFDRLLHLSLVDLTDMKTGGVISRLSGDVNTTSGLLQLGLISPGVSLIRLVLAIGMLFYLNWRLAFAAITVLPVAVAISFLVAKRIRPIYRAVRDDAQHVDGRVGETFGGIRVVRGFQREALESLNYNIGRHEIVRKQLFAERREIALWTVWGFMMSCVGLVTVWFGGYLQVNGRASIGDIMAFQWYAMLLLNPVWQIVNSFSELQRSLAAMERVFEVLEMQPDKPDRKDAVDAPATVESVEFRNVDFQYNEGIPVLTDFSVCIPGGSVVALVGRSGAGKTTVTDLVARFYDPTNGCILVNGKDIRDFRLATYRNLLAVVQQDVFLFDGSVAENIVYGDSSASFEEILDAAKRANADQFIQELPKGYESLIGERGVKLSGGQAQRLSIARAILANPQILILDEATSNLDTESEQLIQSSMRELLAGRTTFVVAHRLSTITDADLILVLDEGKIVERGTHSELMERQGLYTEMVKRQQESMATNA
ncbi:MAG: ABC transporter ATP-binding protein, partial [Planctomycetales bacterium]|nr:ABC transporter ATP-binding protein [Planctomycetales bacterium]